MNRGPGEDPASISEAVNGVKVTIDGEKCQGHGRCSLISPSVFDVDDYGNGLVLVDEVPAEEQDDVEEAVMSCPENAITLEVKGE
jgi:ferredoxin